VSQADRGLGPRCVIRLAGGKRIGIGAVLLASLAAVAHDGGTPPPCGIAFGAGAHFCPMPC
jgi:hypothetical protein